MKDIINSLQNQSVNIKFGGSFKEDPIFGFLVKTIRDKKNFTNQDAFEVKNIVKEYSRELISTDLKLLVKLLKERTERSALGVIKELNSRIKTKLERAK
jgi:hypothetical protein